MVAFTASLVVTALFALIFYWYRGLRVGNRVVFRCRRPVGTPLTWGEAMFSATLVFGAFFWIYGVVPHQWLSWADGDLGWRPDKLLFGPGDILKPQANDGWLPFTMSYQTIRDIIAAGIYIVFLVINVIMWSQWQKRDQAPSEAVERSPFGRPLVREGVR